MSEWCIDCPKCYDRETRTVNDPCGARHQCEECRKGRDVGDDA